MLIDPPSLFASLETWKDFLSEMVRSARKEKNPMFRETLEHHAQMARKQIAMMTVQEDPRTMTNDKSTPGPANSHSPDQTPIRPLMTLTEAETKLSQALREAKNPERRAQIVRAMQVVRAVSERRGEQ